jgi:hypothetical protein
MDCLSYRYPNITMTYSLVLSTGALQLVPWRSSLAASNAALLCSTVHTQLLASVVTPQSALRVSSGVPSEGGPVPAKVTAAHINKLHGKPAAAAAAAAVSSGGQAVQHVV